MAKYIRSFILVGLAAVFVMAGCKKETTQPQQSPLVGTWDLSNMVQTTVIKTANQVMGILPAGYTLADTTVGWNTFQAMGVSLTVDLKDDNTFTMTGNLPIPSDTLGTAPTVLQLTDQGDWNTASDLSTISLEGSLYKVSGDLTLDNPDSPTQIGLFYTESSQDTFSVPLDLTQDQIPDTVISIVVMDSTATTLGFTKQ
ncbi:MAG: hypothetical protein P8Y60_14270 [Calditrichota bacterium]